MKRIFQIVLLALTTTSWAADATTEKIESNGVILYVIEFPPGENCGFSLVDVPDQSKACASKHFQPERDALVINGGYFDPAFKPEGYYQLDGEVISDQLLPKYSGLVEIDQAGAIHLRWKTVPSTGAVEAFQAGPFVIDPGGTIGIYSDSGRKAARTLVGQLQDDSLVIISTTDVSLYQLAHIINKEKPEIERLLNLDGGPSACLYFDEIRRDNRGPVRTFIRKGLSKLN